MRPRRATLLHALHAVHPNLADAEDEIRAGRVTVDGIPVTNPRSLVDPTASVRLVEPQVLRGEVKLGRALDHFQIDVASRVALDVGAAAGGFTKALLAAGAKRVYAVDAGHGQLVGSLRQDERVVNLEATNLSELSRDRVPEEVEVVTIDVSYLSLANAVPQLASVAFAPAADLVALVKPMFELKLPALPPDERLPEAVEAAVKGIERAEWKVLATMPSMVRGAHDAVEFLIHARRAHRA